MSEALTDNDLASIIAGRVREEIERSTISQTELARRLQVSVQCVSHWKSGRRAIPAVKLKLLADELGVPVERLMPPHSRAAA